MKNYKLNKIVLSIKNSPEKFLNGLTSNELDKSNNAFLTINGRILATFDQLKINENQFIILVEKPYVEGLLTHLERYRMLSGAEIEQLDRHVYFDIDPVEEQPGSCLLSCWIIPQKKGRIIISEEPLETNVSEETFTLFRLDNNIPVHGIDFKDEMLLNVSTTEFVSFTKGCYLGQEPISKVYNRSKPTWKLVVKYEDECGDEERGKMTSVMKELGASRRKGFVFVRNV